jgi:prolipoprotein diacylglyceryltransferase
MPDNEAYASAWWRDINTAWGLCPPATNEQTKIGDVCQYLWGAHFILWAIRMDGGARHPARVQAMPKMVALPLNCLWRGLSLLKDHPVLHRSRRLTLVGFGIFAALDAVACALVCYYYLHLKGVTIDWPLAAMMPVCCLLTLCGAKTFHWIALGKKFFANPRKYLGETGYYEHGGIIGAACWVFLVAALFKLPTLLLADAMCWGALLGQFFGRLGCFNYGCCFGKPTSLPLGIRYTNRDSKILRWRPELHCVPVHPTQLYAAGANLPMFFIVGGLLS